MTTATDKTNIIEKIKKLMAVVNDAAKGGEHEREVAMNMVQRLLLKHRIEISEVEDIEEDTIEMSEVFSSATFARTIIFAIGKLNFCKIYFTRLPSAKARFTFIGREHEIMATIQLCKIIIKSVSREARKGAKIYSHDKSYTRSFENGASYRISERAYDIIKNVKENPEAIMTDIKVSSATSLVIANSYDEAEEKNAKYMEGTGVKIKSKRPRMQNSSADGFYDGDRFGKTVNIK